MDEGATLIEGFVYDFWANTAWLAALPQMPDPKRPLEVLEHIAWAQARWIKSARPGIVLPEGSLDDRLKILHDGWIETIRGEDLSRVVQHTTTTGVLYPCGLAAICRHVIDHGTYHRGHLRGLAEMQGWDDFPEVGLIGFYRVFDLHT